MKKASINLKLMPMVLVYLTVVDKAMNVYLGNVPWPFYRKTFWGLGDDGKFMSKLDMKHSKFPFME